MKIKIIFILPSLRPGGAERVISYIASNLNSKLFVVKLIIIGYEEDNAYDVSTLEVKYLNKKRVLLAVLELYQLIQKEKPNIVFSSIIHVNILMGFFSLFIKNTSFIAREASVISSFNKYSKVNSKLQHFLIRLFYTNFSKIICQSFDMKEDLINGYNFSPTKLVVINNPISLQKSFPSKVFDNNMINFITVGRLSKEKGHIRIIDTLSKVKNYSYHYTIIGSGSEKEKIIEKIEGHDISDSITFIPYTSEVLLRLSQNDYYLQGSYVEGFPNALLESCSVGTPSIAFNAPGGTKEIIENGKNGFIVEDENGFLSVLNDIKKLKTIDRLTTKEIVLSKFNGEKIMNEYENLFLDVMKSSN